MTLRPFRSLAFATGAAAAVLLTLTLAPSPRVARTVTIIETVSVVPATDRDGVEREVRQLPTVYVSGRRSLVPVDDPVASAQISCFRGRC